MLPEAANPSSDSPPGLRERGDQLELRVLRGRHTLATPPGLQARVLRGVGDLPLQGLLVQGDRGFAEVVDLALEQPALDQDAQGRAVDAWRLWEVTRKTEPNQKPRFSNRLPSYARRITTFGEKPR